ncbi:uncharacterized protein VDAG_06026 [Verticillium dahliae VdLs.17]|uniref:Uncharacterized protein n=3 Tax=Verticillium TaxID=1036719 RepID=G2X885_VERDV|nr:uncharacterized protein VDAG_06026 [Verticillium dahliae VdLs.17]EGY15172.1 hypothetical protein VDAG_06026 [Verticillium dahliae VdLs.17]KAG7122383.1 hypothetical protein HYQ44_003281 [Verticillium longisporum]
MAGVSEAAAGTPMPMPMGLNNMSRYNYTNSPVIHQGAASIRSSASYSTTYSGQSSPSSYRSYSPAETIREQQYAGASKGSGVVVHNGYSGHHDQRYDPTPKYSNPNLAKRKS